MRVLAHFLVFYLYIITISGDQEAEEEGNRKRIIEQLTRTRTFLIDDYHLVTRQIATNVHMYRSYRTVSVVFYPLMRDVTDAHFTFQSEELHLNAIGRFWHNFFIYAQFIQLGILFIYSTHTSVTSIPPASIFTNLI